jgi:hypothetical protein
MFEKWDALVKNIVKVHFWSTICGIVCIIPSYVASRACFIVGANSIYLTFLYGAYDECILLAKFSAWWFFLFPIGYVISYILSKRKQIYSLFLTLICADTIFVVFAAVYEFSRNNMYGFNYILVDAFVSIVYAIIFIVAIGKYKATYKV